MPYFCPTKYTQIVSMNYLSVELLTKSFGERVLFEDVSFGIDKGDKVALIAKNGAGKSTLMGLLAERDTADSGSIVFRKGLRVAFLDQDSNFDGYNSIEEVIYEADHPQVQASKAYSLALENTDDTDAFQKALDMMEETQAWDVEARIKDVLYSLQLEDHLKKPLGLLSGGQKKRLALSKVLIEQPDLLVLDEPTNHLDLSMIEWLQTYLNQSSMTLFMVTHDRYFLDAICNTILEMEDESIYRYKGNYGYYLEKKQLREEELKVTIGKAKNLFKKELEWMRRQPKARGTKSKARIDSFQDIKKVAKQNTKKEEVQLEIQMQRLGSKIMELHHLNKSFDDHKILEDFNYTFVNRDRIGIVGKNGAGKTTFLNMLCGDEPYDAGKIVHGETLRIGYYTQEGMSIPDDKRVIEVVKDVAEVIPLNKGRKLTAAQLLERFLFTKDAQWSMVSKLSGGEKKRLYLLTILMKNPNFLILDEPTNDLDIATLNILEEFLDEFPGCLIIISHDRYFMDRLVDHLFVFEGEGKIKDFPGNYTDYRLAKSTSKAEKPVAITTKKEEPKDKVSHQNREQKLSFKEKRELEDLEGKMEKIEQEKNTISQEFYKEDQDPEIIAKLSIRLHEIEQQSEEMMTRWMELSEKQG